MRGEGRDRIEEQGRRWRKERRARGEREKKAEIDGGREREDRERETERERERERERVLTVQRRLNGTPALVVVFWVVVASMAVARKAIAAAREALQEL